MRILNGSFPCPCCLPPGSDAYGYWVRLLDHPEGPSYTTSVCPKFTPLGRFENNVAHSNMFYGLRVHPEYYPKKVGQQMQGQKCLPCAAAKIACLGRDDIRIQKRYYGTSYYGSLLRDDKPYAWPLICVSVPYCVCACAGAVCGQQVPTGPGRV